MRVIAGDKRGIPLKSIDGMDTRPTLDRVKESFFSSIQFEIPGRQVLDLFAGSGSLGIEALSRGAQSCMFVDENAACVRIIRENLNKTGYSGAARVENMAFDRFLCAGEGELPYTLIFLDPPYHKGLIQKSLDLLAPRIKKDTILVAEFEKDAIISLSDEFCLKKKLSYRINEAAILIRE